MGRCWGLLLTLSGLPAGRSNTAPGQLLLPTGCTVVFVPIIGIIKMIFFFQWVFPGLLWIQTLFSLCWPPALCLGRKTWG